MNEVRVRRSYIYIVPIYIRIYIYTVYTRIYNIEVGQLTS
jgi:hypothetical protein